MNTAVIETHQQSHESGVSLETSNGFAVTPCVEELVESAIAYLKSGYPVHFSGWLELEKLHWPSTLLQGLRDP